MNANQARRKMQDRQASLRDYRYVPHAQQSYSPIEMEAARVNAATREEERDIGPPDPTPNNDRY